MQESPGTSKEDALQNQLLRQTIMAKEDVTKLFQTYTLPEGCVCFDGRMVSQHVRSVINEMKKKKNNGVYDRCFVSYSTSYDFIL